MPTYEYACKNCGEHLEVVQSFTDDPITVCPTCGGQLRKVFGNIGIAFKGSGFYKNDSRSSSSAASTKKSETKPAGDSPGGDSAKPAETKGAETKSGQSKSAESKGAETKTSASPGKGDGSKAAAS